MCTLSRFTFSVIPVPAELSPYLKMNPVHSAGSLLQLTRNEKTVEFILRFTAVALSLSFRRVGHHYFVYQHIFVLVTNCYMT